MSVPEWSHVVKGVMSSHSPRALEAPPAPRCVRFQESFVVLVEPPQTRPPEPILFPKLRIELADFPRPLRHNRSETIRLGDLLRSCGTVEQMAPTPEDLQGAAEYGRITKQVVTYARDVILLLGTNPFGRHVPCPSREESPVSIHGHSILRCS